MNKIDAARMFLEGECPEYLLDIYPDIPQYTINEICDFLDQQDISSTAKFYRLVLVLDALTGKTDAV